MDEKLESAAHKTGDPFEQWGKADADLLKFKPDFFAITPPRCGSTWLFENLRRHPEIFIPPFKEVKYFSTYWKMCDINWYLECFKEGCDKKRGEVSPSYAILTDQMLRSIRRIMPNLHIIILFRDPIERSWSHAKHQFRFKESVFASFNEIYENVPESKFIDCLTNTWMMVYSDYLSMLRRWVAIFPKENIYINFFDSIVTKPKSLLEEIFFHIGVSKSVDWSRFPIQEKFFQGIEQEIPVKIKNVLLSLYHKRTKEFGDFLLDNFGLKIPESWNYISHTDKKHKELHIHHFSDDNNQIILEDVLTRESIQSTHIQVLKEDYKGFKIIAFRGECIAISKELAEINMLQMSKTDFEKYKREGKILCSETLKEVLSLIDADRDAMMKLLNEEIASRDDIIQRQEKELKVKESRIIELQNYVGDRDSRIEALQGEIADRDLRIEGLEEEVSARDGNIKVLTEKLESHRENIEALEKEVSDKDGEIRGLITGFGERDKAVEILEKEIAERDLRIEGLQKEALQKENNIAKLNIEVKECKKEIENLEAGILQKNRNIEILKKDISNKDENVAKLSNDIEARNKIIDTLQEHLLEKDKNIEALNKDISKRDEEISKLNNESTVIRSYIKELQEEIVNIKSKWWFKFFNRKG